MSAPAAPHVVVVGAGHAGVQVTDSLRHEGYDGRITLIDKAPVLPYQRPPLSKDYVATESDVTALPLRPQSFYDANGIDLIRSNSVTALDRSARTVLLSDGRAVEYTTLVLATGAESRRLTLPGLDAEGVHELRTLADAEALRPALDHARSVAVIGAGFVGLEFAASARKRGLPVTVVESSARVLERAVSSVMSNHLVQAHRAAGTIVHTSVHIERIETTNGRVSAVIAPEARFPADLVLVAVGVQPRDELAASAGLGTSDGVLVDGRFRTNDPTIFAVGDCARFTTSRHGPLRLESVQNATDHGKHVARAILGGAKEYAAVPWFWSNQGALRLQIAGRASNDCTAVVCGDPGESRFSAVRFRGDDLVAVESLNRPADHLAARQVLAQGIALSPADIASPGFSLKDYARQFVSTSQP